MQYEVYSFRQQQWLYLLEAANKITGPVFRPDHKTPDDIEELAEDYSDKLGELMEATLDVHGKRAARANAHSAGHTACVDVYACLKSCYRSEAVCLAQLTRLPKADRTPDQTLRRMEALALCWAGLPNVTGTTSPVSAVGEITKTRFTTMTEALRQAIKDEVAAERAEGDTGAVMRVLDGEAENFINAALVQGRAAYATNSPARSYIDAVPTQPSTQPPEQAQITLAESPTEGAVHLGLAAEHATSFQIWQKGPEDAEFVKVGEVLKPGDYSVAGLAGGDYEFKAIGINSRGEGPASEVVTVTVREATVPEQAQIVVAESPAPGAAHLAVAAEGATTFHILHKGPGMAQFALVANLAASGSVDYVTSNLAAGVHEYKARGLNARGIGQESEVVVLEVEAAQAA